MTHDEPKYDLRCDLDPKVHAAAMALIREGKNMHAVKLLVQDTRCNVQDAMGWIGKHNPGEQTPCPYCHAPLPTRQAQQCLSCGMDWHHPDQVVRRGDPHWNRFGLKREELYVVELCQGTGGRRYTKYREVTNGRPDLEAAFETEPATGLQFIEWGDMEYARHLRLTSGELFCFDPFGYWITEKEVDYLKRRDAGQLAPGEQPPLVHGSSPWLRTK